MHYRCYLLVALLGSLALARPGECPAAETPAVPLLGVVSKGRVFTVIATPRQDGPKYNGHLELIYSPLAKPERKRFGVPNYSGLYPVPLWRIAHGQFYGAHRSGFPTAEYLLCWRLEEFVAGKCVLGPAKHSIEVEDNKLMAMAWANMITDLREQRLFRLMYDREIHYDYLPVREGRVRLFLLTNFRANTNERQLKPAWKLDIYLFDGKWEKGKGFRNDSPWVHEESIAGACEEGFRVFARGDDYYLLTHSGRLLVAAKADKGKRKLRAVWDDPKRPVEAAVQYDPKGEAFFFCGPAKAAEGGKPGKPAWFALSGKPELQEYDPKAFAEVKLEGPLGRLVRYAKVLAAHDHEPR